MLSSTSKSYLRWKLYFSTIHTKEKEFFLCSSVITILTIVWKIKKENPFNFSWHVAVLEQLAVCVVQHVQAVEIQLHLDLCMLLC